MCTLSNKDQINTSDNCATSLQCTDRVGSLHQSFGGMVAEAPALRINAGHLCEYFSRCAPDRVQCCLCFQCQTTTMYDAALDEIVLRLNVVNLNQTQKYSSSSFKDIYSMFCSEVVVLAPFLPHWINDTDITTCLQDIVFFSPVLLVIKRGLR